jgi:hypothetical protein
MKMTGTAVGPTGDGSCGDCSAMGSCQFLYEQGGL